MPGSKKYSKIMLSMNKEYSNFRLIHCRNTLTRSEQENKKKMMNIR